jgi:hypothetical protein
LAKIAAFCLGVLFCSYIAQADLPPASDIPEIAKMLLQYNLAARKMGALGGYHLRRRESS